MIRALCAAALACAAFSAPAQVLDAGRKLAASCAMCHGTQGRPATDAVVSLAGVPSERIATAMREFRDGRRPATVMHLIAKGYREAEIEAIAAWFAAQKPR